MLLRVFFFLDQKPHSSKRAQQPSLYKELRHEEAMHSSMHTIVIDSSVQDSSLSGLLHHSPISSLGSWSVRLISRLSLSFVFFCCLIFCFVPYVLCLVPCPVLSFVVVLDLSCLQFLSFLQFLSYRCLFRNSSWFVLACLALWCLFKVSTAVFVSPPVSFIVFIRHIFRCCLGSCVFAIVFVFSRD
jgi:hypothetical protein